MFFIPLEKNIDWKSPPVITLLLVIINTFCYFGFQSNDNKSYSVAVEYYFDSGLANIELPYYAEYLENKKNIFARFIKEENKENKENKKLSKRKKFTLFSKMLNDGDFLTKLENEQIIKNTDVNYSKWKSLSAKFKRKINKATFYSYGLKTYKVTFTTIFSHMFLHANFEHLFWNMVFLFIFGFSVEMILGWQVYLSAYLLAGIGSAFFWVMLEPGGAVPGIGASGAISGLVGMYTVLFGLRKIRFIYFLFVFYDTIKAPALITLPLWLGYQLYSHYFTPSHINNLAHAGGIISGALIAYIAKKIHKNINTEYMDENNVKESFNKRFAKGMELVASLKIDQAKNIFLQLNKENPENIAILKQLFNLSKFDPKSDDFHNFARNIINTSDDNPQTNKDIIDVYNEYVTRAKPAPKLNAEIMFKLFRRFLKEGLLEDAEKIIALLLKNKIKNQNMLESLQIMINKYSNVNLEKSTKYKILYDNLVSKN